MNPSDADWWWLYGLQGIVAGIVGGLMAAAAVWVTLRHERRMTDLSSARALAAQIAGQTRMMKEMESRRPWSHDETARVIEYVQLLQEMEARLDRRWIHAALVLSIALLQVNDVLDDPKAEGTNLEYVADGVGKFCHEWIGDPEFFEDAWYLRAVHWRPYPKGRKTGFDRRMRWLFGFGDGDFSAISLEEREERAKDG